MTVEELIKILNKYPEDTQVFYESEEGRVVPYIAVEETDNGIVICWR